MGKADRQMQRQFAQIRSIDPAGIILPGERFKYGIKDLAVGGVYRLKGLTYLVEELGTYRETDDAFEKDLPWTGHELKVTCLETGKTHNIEWEEDDEIEISQTLEDVPYSDLYYDDGESIAPDSDDLDEIAEKGWEIKFRDTLYDYEDDYAAWYEKGGGKGREKVYFYAFESGRGQELTIEVWIQENGKEFFQVFISEGVDPDELEVITAGGRNP